MKKLTAICLSLLLLTGCASGGTAITVVSREEGSGTRDAFVELTGVKTQEGDGTTTDAEIANSTSLVQHTVAGNSNAIGYLSLGAYDAALVKAVPIDGAEPTADNIKAGRYPVSRPFVLCYREDVLSALGRDFMAYILSAEGQSILTDSGYIAVTETVKPYQPSGLTGRLSLDGSTSVGPVMEKLAERYSAQNPGAVIQIQQTGSGTGIVSAIDGICEIGMSSRELKAEELAAGLTAMTIALDGIVVVVHRENPVETLTTEQLRRIYTGEITDWSGLA